MRLPSFSPLLLILALFFGASILLTIRQNSLLSQAEEDLVMAGYLNPSDENNHQFFLSQGSTSARTITLEYHFDDAKVTQETLSLDPKEYRVLTPSSAPRSVTIRYQTRDHQEQTLTLYKK